MTLPNTYADGNCPLARTLEVVGERWTLMIIRDAFYGVRRFGDFATQLGIPRAVLTNRLKSLVQEGVLTREDDGVGGIEYRLTDKGVALWPAVHALMNWGRPSTPRTESSASSATTWTEVSSTTTDTAETVVQPSRSRRSGSNPDPASTQPAPKLIPSPTRSTHHDDFSSRS